ncbi:MAG: phosphoribosylglycinamide formyltransferase, partial [Fimbriimonadaceae bacterium]|nr:phosphoribosylglycinamide formyltransferase [Chitinophagales bacterium]
MNSGSDNFSSNKMGTTIFASGKGSNAENLIHYFKEHAHIYINLVVTNNPKAEVIQKAEKNNIPVKIFSETDWQNVEAIIAYLRSYKTQYIILAGYLQLLPSVFIQAFPHRILNIHPALLPKYGGKGMYGKYVHTKVFENKETETGITVHELNEKYDEGKI